MNNHVCNPYDPGDNALNTNHVILPFTRPPREMTIAGELSFISRIPLPSSSHSHSTHTEKFEHTHPVPLSQLPSQRGYTRYPPMMITMAVTYLTFGRVILQAFPARFIIWPRTALAPNIARFFASMARSQFWLLKGSGWQLIFGEANRRKKNKTKKKTNNANIPAKSGVAMGKRLR